MAVHEAGNLILIKLGDAHPNAPPHCSIRLSQTNRPSLAPCDDQDYPFSLIVVSANSMKLGPAAAPEHKK